MALDAMQVFYERLAAHDADTISELFEPQATFECVALGVSGDGFHVGGAYWRAMIEAFPNLGVDIRRMWVDETGDVAFAEIELSGAAAPETLGGGKRLRCRQLHVVEVGESGGIASMTCFWNGADMSDRPRRLDALRGQLQ